MLRRMILIARRNSHCVQWRNKRFEPGGGKA